MNLCGSACEVGESSADALECRASIAAVLSHHKTTPFLDNQHVMDEARLPRTFAPGPLSQRAHIDHNLYPTGKAGVHCDRVEPLDAELCGDREETCGTLPYSPDCSYYFVKRFYHEPPGFCCSEGEVMLASTTMPAVLARLFTGSDAESVTLRKYFRTYNNNLAFTTFSARKDNELLKNNQGIYTFKVQGKIHHYLSCLERNSDTPTSLHLYFYDPATELEERLRLSTKFSRDVMARLMEVLSENPYAMFLRQLKDLECIDDYKIFLVSNPSLDQRVYNEPTCTDVSAIISLTLKVNFNPQCQIQIYSKSALPYIICHIYGCYDPLHYPLLFPRGEVGWHCGIEKLLPNRQKRRYTCHTPLDAPMNSVVDADQLLSREKQAFEQGVRKRNIVSCRQYYCYKF